MEKNRASGFIERQDVVEEPPTFVARPLQGTGPRQRCPEQR
jgi:hypothetical protein